MGLFLSYETLVYLEQSDVDKLTRVLYNLDLKFYPILNVLFLYNIFRQYKLSFQMR